MTFINGNLSNIEAVREIVDYALFLIDDLSVDEKVNVLIDGNTITINKPDLNLGEILTDNVEATSLKDIEDIYDEHK